MYCLNQRMGTVFKESNTENKKTYSIHYFFINENRTLFYLQSLARLLKVIKVSKNQRQISYHLNKMGEKRFELSKYQLLNTKQFNADGLLPFSNRLCIEIKQKTNNQILKLIPIADEDVGMLYQFLKGETKIESANRRSSFLQEQQEKQEKLIANLFEKYLEFETNLKLVYSENQTQISEGLEDQTKTNNKQIIRFNQNLHYLGEVKQGRPNGEGKQVLLKEGIAYNGSFMNGKKHGKGYIVNSNLDTLYCEFIEDQICGI